MSYTSYGQWIVSVSCDTCGRAESFKANNSGAAHRLAREAGWSVYPAQSKAKCARCKRSVFAGKA